MVLRYVCPTKLIIDIISRHATNTYIVGLINNVLYVIILSAALDLVGPAVPKGVVLVANVLPSFGTKLVAPYFIQQVPYSVRIIIIVCGASAGMLLISLTPDSRDGGVIAAKMCAVAIASLMSGLGELSFLGLTHYYGPFSLAAWGSGTGAAGLVGAGVYVLATTTLGLAVRTTLLLSALFPIIMLLSFFLILPREPLKHFGRGVQYTSVNEDDNEHAEPTDDGIDAESPSEEHGHLLSNSITSASGRSFNSVSKQDTGFAGLKANLMRARKLFVP